MEAATWGLVLATYLACFVEMVEATTIVLAMGYTRSWRSALLGVAAAVIALAAATVAFGYALARWLPESALQLVIGSLLLIFGLQWLRKAILRSSGRKAVHDEDAIYAAEVDAARAAGRGSAGLDLFSFMVSFKALSPAVVGVSTLMEKEPIRYIMSTYRDEGVRRAFPLLLRAPLLREAGKPVHGRPAISSKIHCALAYPSRVRKWFPGQPLPHSTTVT